MAELIALNIEGLGKLKADLRVLKRTLQANNILAKIASQVRNMIVERTLRGVSAGLVKFKPYSTKPLYIPKDHRPSPKGGRRQSLSGKPMKTVFYEGGYQQFAASTKGSATPNLFATGDMFRAFQAASRGNALQATIEFTRRFPALKAAANNVKRKFVGIHKGRELPLINRMFARMLFREIKKLDL